MSSAPIILGGPGNYEAWIVDRALRQRLTILPWSSLRFDRVLDDCSTATLSVPTDHQRTLHGARPWKHGVGLWRNGALEWVGPIITIGRGVNSDEVDVRARDIIAWTQKRFVRTSIPEQTADLGHFFDLLIAEAARRDNPFGLTSSTPNTRVPAVREYLADNDSQVFAGIQELARTGMDFTVWRKEILSGPTDELFTGFLIVDQNAFVGQIGIELDGMAQGNSHRTAAGGTGGSEGFTLIGEWEDWDQEFGLLETFESESLIKDITSAEAASIKRWETLHETPRAVTFPPISHLFPGTFDELIPGKVWRVQIRDDLFDIAGDYRITKVTVDVQVQPDGTISETITPELVNVGSPAVFPELTVTANPVPDTDPDPEGEVIILHDVRAWDGLVSPDPDAYIANLGTAVTADGIYNWQVEMFDVGPGSYFSAVGSRVLALADFPGFAATGHPAAWSTLGGLPNSAAMTYMIAVGDITASGAEDRAFCTLEIGPFSVTFTQTSVDGWDIFVFDPRGDPWPMEIVHADPTVITDRMVFVEQDFTGDTPHAKVWLGGTLVTQTSTSGFYELDSLYPDADNFIFQYGYADPALTPGAPWAIVGGGLIRGKLDASGRNEWHNYFFGA